MTDGHGMFFDFQYFTVYFRNPVDTNNVTLMYAYKIFIRQLAVYAFQSRVNDVSFSVCKQAYIISERLNTANSIYVNFFEVRILFYKKLPLHIIFFFPNNLRRYIENFR